MTALGEQETWGGRPVVRACHEARARHRARLTGRVLDCRVLPLGGGWALEATLDDGTGQVLLRFLGRQQVEGVLPGVMLEVDGTLVDLHGRLGLLNPRFEVVLGPAR